MSLELINAFSREHICLFKRLINKAEFTTTIQRIYLNNRSQENAVKIVEALTTFYMKNITTNNLYEHPIIQ